MKAIICSFESGLSDIPASKRGDEEYVIEVLKKNGRFTCFEASEHMKLARTLTMLKKQGRIVYPIPQPEYPWNMVEVCG